MNAIVGIGTDIVECLRIRRMIDRHAELFLTRVYTDAEVRFCNECRQTTEHFAAFWAAKEAVFKSLGTRWHKGMVWTEVEVTMGRTGEVAIELRGGARDLAESRGVARFLATVAYCRTYATASVIALGN